MTHVVELYDALAPQLDRVREVEELPAAVHPNYRADLLAVLGDLEGRRVLEPGCGPGLFAELLRGLGAVVTLNDASPRMLERAIERNPGAPAVLGCAEGVIDLFSAGEFDRIVCRDLVHHLRDPIRAFRGWRRWLVPGGRVAVIDAFWSRDDWSGDWSARADDSPLGCTQTATSVSYMLEQSGFAIRHRGLMRGVNAFFTGRAENGRRVATRYLVVADAVEATSRPETTAGQPQYTAASEAAR